MVKQGWSRKEKIVTKDNADPVIVQGTMKAIASEFNVDVRIKSLSMSIYSVSVNRSALRDACLIHGFVDKVRPSYQAVIDAFVKAWNTSLIDGVYYDKPESERQLLSESFVKMIMKNDQSRCRKADLISDDGHKVINLKLDEQNNIVEWAEV